MSDVITMTKKAFTWSVVVLTVLWSVGISAFVPMMALAAECPALEAGDLMKAEVGSAVYILDADLNARYFPNSEVFHSWYKDFSGVVTLSADCFDNYPAADGVNYMPGSYLVKRVETPTVYAVLPGNMVAAIGSAEVASALYGPNWGTLVRDVHTFHWTNYTQSGDVWNEAMPHDGQLVKTSASAQVYFIEDGMAKPVAGDLGEWSKFVRMVSDVVFDTVETSAVTITPATIVEDPTQGATSGSTPSTPAVSGGDVSVSLSASSPVATDIISDSTANEYPESQIPFVTVNFTAGSEDTVVKTVKFTRSGISADADLGNMYLYEGNTKLAEYQSFNDKVLSFNSSAGLFTVPAGTTRSITLKGDLARGSTSVTAGKKIAFQIASVDHVVIDGGTVAGSFPVQGAEMETIAVSDLGHVYINSTSTYPTTVKADEANKELWRFTLNADAQDMQVRYVKLTLVGSTDVDDIQNLRLEVAGTQVGTAVDLNSAREAIFDLASTPISVISGQNKIVVLRGDMMGGSGRTFKFTIQRITDVVTYDTEYSAYVNVALTSATGGFRLVQPTTGTGTSVDSGTLTIGIASDSPTGSIVDNGTNLTFAKYTFDASGEDVKIDNLSLTCTGTGTNEDAKNIKLLLNGTQVGTTDASTTCDGSSTSAFSFGNTFIVDDSVDSVLTVVADTTDSQFADGDTISFSLVAGSSNGQGQVTLTSLSTAASTGRTLTVKSGIVSIAENAAFGDKTSSLPTGTVNATAAKLASFTITAGTGEAADVTQILLAENSSSPLGNNFQNLKVMNGTVQIGNTISSLNTTAGTYTFTPATAIRIAAGGIYVVDVYADIKSSAADSGNPAWAAVKYGANAITATGVSTGGNISSSNSATDLQNVYIASSGNLTATINGSTKISDHLVMGNTGYSLATFDLAADAAEDIRVTDFTATVSTTASSQGTLGNFSLWVDGLQVGNTVASLPLSASSGTVWYNVTFTNVGLVIPRNTTKVVTMKTDVTTYDNGATSATVSSGAILNDVDSEKISALGNSSGASITGAALDIGGTSEAHVEGNNMTTYRTKVTIAFASDTPSGAASGSDTQTVGKFVITNSSNVGNYNATIKNMNFTLGHTALSNDGDGTQAISVYKDDTSSSANQLATSNEPAGQNYGATAFTEGNFTDVTIAAGTQKTFVLVVDTSDAGTNDRFSVTLPATAVTWSDGVTSSITETIGAPTDTKTFTY